MTGEGQDRPAPVRPDKRALLKGLFQAALGLAVFVVAFSFGATPTRTDHDVWWHLKTGQYLVEVGRPHIEPFNHVAEGDGVVWHNHEWLGQMLAWHLYQMGESWGVGGLRLLIVLKALWLGATYLLLAWVGYRLCGAWLPAVVAAIIMAEVGRRTLYLRPPVYSYPLLIATYYACHQLRVGRLHWAWGWTFVAPFFTLWANVHGAWAAGLVVIASFAGGAVVEAAGRYWRRAPLVEYPARVIRAGYPWALLLVLAVLGTLINPSGVELYAIFGRVMKDTRLVNAIAELRPPDVALSGMFLLSIIVFFALAAMVPRRFPHAAEFLLVPFFMWQALHHWRHLTLYGLLAAPMLAWYLAEALRSLPKGIAGLARVALAAGTLLGVVYLIGFVDEGGTFLKRNRDLVLEGVDTEPGEFLDAECRFLIQARLAPKLLNLDYYAGYLIWRLSPKPYQVYSDARFDIFGGRIAHEVDSILVLSSGWEEKLEERGVNLALLPADKMLALTLAQHEDWTIVYYRPTVWRLKARGYGREFDEYQGWVIAARNSANTPESLAAARSIYNAFRQGDWPDPFGAVTPLKKRFKSGDWTK